MLDDTLVNWSSFKSVIHERNLHIGKHEDSNILVCCQVDDCAIATPKLPAVCNFMMLLAPPIVRLIALSLAAVSLLLELSLHVNLNHKHAVLSAALKVNSVLLSQLLKLPNVFAPFSNNLFFHQIILMTKLALQR